VANCTINGKHILAIVDTGSYKNILDIGMAKILKLPIREAVNGDCGTYSVPGTG
jgi:predicted aspartyl protease